jgi:Skp family chaperone for outer membrane proteins
MTTFAKTLSMAIMAVSLTVATAPAVQAQVAGLASVNKIRVIMGTKAFKDGYNAIRSQNQPQIDRMDVLQRELDALSKPMDSNGDGQLSEQDQAWKAALQLLDTTMKSMDKNKDGNLTGTELEELRARNLPAQQILIKQREMEAIQQNIQLAELYVVDSIDKKYDEALKGIVTAKKINAVLTPEAFEWAPPEADISNQMIAALDRSIPAVQMPMPEKFSTSQEAINLRAQIERIVVQNAIAQARAQQAQQQQAGAQPAAAPAQAQPRPAGPATDPNADAGTGG